MSRPDDAWIRCFGPSSGFVIITILWYRAGSSLRRPLTYASAMSPALAIHSATNPRSSGVAKVQEGVELRPSWLDDSTEADLAH